MSTIRLYHAIKEYLEAKALYDAARFTGNYTPDKALPHSDPTVLRYRSANTELGLAMDEAKEIMEAPSDRNRDVGIRIAGEKDVGRYLVKSLLDQGFEISLNNGDEDDEDNYTNNFDSIVNRMFETDECYLNLRKTGFHGWIWLVYGNSPEELMSNMTVNVVKYTIPTQKYIRSFYDRNFVLDKEDE